MTGIYRNMIPADHYCGHRLMITRETSMITPLSAHFAKYIYSKNINIT